MEVPGGSRVQHYVSWNGYKSQLCTSNVSFHISSFRWINPHVSVGWWRRPNFLEDKGNDRAHVCAWSNEWRWGYSWMTFKKTLRWSVEQIRHCCVTSTLDVLEIQNTSGRRKTPGQNRLNVILFWRHECTQMASTLEIQLFISHFYTKGISQNVLVICLNSCIFKCKTQTVPLQSGRKHCWSCCLLFSLSGVFLPNSISVPQWQLSQTIPSQNSWLDCFLKVFSVEKLAARNDRNSLAEPLVIVEKFNFLLCWLMPQS